MKKEDYYCLVMFPYPSGSGLHVGHYYNYALMDSYCRWKEYKGYNVFQPFGYDSFGLPAENYAKKIGGDPKEITYQNINNFRKQMELMNTNFEEKLITSDPSYQKWSQFIFNVMKDRGLAYKKNGEVNYCNSCETVLANEQVIDDHCERCSNPIEKKVMNQWYFKITDYIDRLENDLNTVDYPEKTIKQQRHWFKNMRENNIDWCISRQRKWGCPIPIEGETDTMDTFVDSSFYYIRYCDPFNEEEICATDNFKQVDLCVGGNEHACAHLIYARFVMKVLYDAGYVPVSEPFKRVVHNGFILRNGEKMSKSKGNTINPDNYDPDALRFYLMFLNHYFDGGNWTDQNFKGVERFIKRFVEWMSRSGEDTIPDIDDFINKINVYCESFKFNKVVSEFMTLVNNHRTKNLTNKSKEEIISIIEIFMPSIREKFI